MSISSKLRLAGKAYDAPGYYFVTLCADERRPLFGRLAGETIALSPVGEAVAACWQEIPEHFPDTELHEFVVMPDHVHGIIRITRWQRPKNILGEQETRRPGTRHGSLGSIIKGFKIGVAKACRAKTSFGHPVFQENYYDVICFDAAELAVKEAYIRANPLRLAVKQVPCGMRKKSRYLGNLALLDAELKFALRLSRRATDTEIETISKRLRAYGGVTVSTFFSPGEQAVLNDLLEHGSARFIWLLPMAMPDKPPSKWCSSLVHGRALWLAPFPDAPDATRSACMACNAWIESLTTHR